MDIKLVIIKPDKILSAVNGFEILYNIHKIYPNSKLMLNRRDEVDLGFIDKLRSKESE